MESYRAAYRLTDLPLTEAGERNARRLVERLKGLTFAKVFTSPLQRAARTCELAGFGRVAEVDPDLVEWNYGEYEGLRGSEIRATRPDWEIFRDGCPGGETHTRWLHARTAWSAGCALWPTTFCCSRVDTFLKCCGPVDWYLKPPFTPGPFF